MVASGSSLLTKLIAASILCQQASFPLFENLVAQILPTPTPSHAFLAILSIQKAVSEIDLDRSSLVWGLEPLPIVGVYRNNTIRL